VRQSTSGALGAGPVRRRSRGSRGARRGGACALHRSSDDLRPAFGGGHASAPPRVWRRCRPQARELAAPRARQRGGVV